MRTIAKDQDGLTRIAGRLTGAGAITSSAGSFTATKTGTGTYQIRLLPSPLVVLSAQATVEAGSAFIATVAAFGGNTFTVVVSTVANAPVDGPFHFGVVAR